MQKSAIHFVFRHHFVVPEVFLSQPPSKTLVILQDIRPAVTFFSASPGAAQQSFKRLYLPVPTLTMVWPANNPVHPVLNLHSLLMVASVQWAVQTEDNSSVLPLNWIHHLVLICRDLVHTDTKCHPKSINASLQFFNYLFFLGVAKEEILTNNFFPLRANYESLVSVNQYIM